jgi:hypothetical protein
MKFSQRLILTVIILFFPVLMLAQEKVNLQGAWEMVSQKIDGVDHPIPGRQIKLLTADHYAWVKQDKKQVEDLLAKGTLRDSLMAYHDEFGAGTYKVEGDSYTETTEFFYEPQYIGTSLTFKFKMKEGLWYNTGHYTHFANGKKINEILLEEVWKRID